MDTTKKIELLRNANAQLMALNPMKHVEITIECVEKTYKRNLLSIGADAKTVKGTKLNYLTGILYLMPASLSGVNICPKSSAGCRAACLASAGRGRFYSVTRARMVKTLAYHFDTTRFVATIKKSIKTLATKAKNKSMIPVVRLNGTSDIAWELTTDIIQSNPLIQFYDYTKISKRFQFTIPANYHLTFSLAENNENDAINVLRLGGNVAAVFRTKSFPLNYLGFKVISGDNTDLRFLDEKGCIVALFAKGKAKTDSTGFVKDYGMEVAKAA